jgi:hypothetical protein
MAPAAGKASYKTYEAQARLVRAIVAAHPNVKWDYKGKPMTISLVYQASSPVLSESRAMKLSTMPGAVEFLMYSLLRQFSWLVAQIDS